MLINNFLTYPKKIVPVGANNGLEPAGKRLQKILTAQRGQASPYKGGTGELVSREHLTHAVPEDDATVTNRLCDARA